jgi:hypothetical protein
MIIRPRGSSSASTVGTMLDPARLCGSAAMITAGTRGGQTRASYRFRAGPCYPAGMSRGLATLLSALLLAGSAAAHASPSDVDRVAGTARRASAPS